LCRLLRGVPITSAVLEMFSRSRAACRRGTPALMFP
jgi:hypothetical protein